MIFVAWVVCAAFIFKLLWNVSNAFDAAVEQGRDEERSPHPVTVHFEVGLLGVALLLYWWADTFPFDLGFVGSLAVGAGLIVASYLIIFPVRFVCSRVLSRRS